MSLFLQTVSFNANAQVNLFWQDFKSIVLPKNLPIQYITNIDGPTGITSYIVFALDGNVAYICSLVFPVFSPTYAFVPPYSQPQNDSDTIDFQINFIGAANQPINNNTTTANKLLAVNKLDQIILLLMDISRLLQVQNSENSSNAVPLINAGF